MSSAPSNDPLMQQLQLLLTGYGYNFYNKTNQVRSDDQLVRERASYYLANASALLTQLRSDYHTRFVPPLTRANPDPPAEALAQINEITSVQQVLDGIEAHIRAMPVPTQDRTWWRIRQEHALLIQLLTFDLTLVRSSEQIYDYIAQLTPEHWQQQGSSVLRQMLRQLTTSAQERERFLLLPL